MRCIFSLSVVILLLLSQPVFFSHAYSDNRGITNIFKKKKKESKDSESKKDSTETKLKAYKEIVGAGTQTQDGMFRVHKKKNDYYFEIPSHLLNRDLLVINKMQKVPQALNDAGVNKGINYENQLIRFERNNDENKLMVRAITPVPLYPEGDAIGQSVRDNFISPLIDGFKIEAFNADSSAVLIKINDIYNGTETSINNVFNSINLGTSAIKNLSRIVSAKAFQNNVAVLSELTTKVTEGASTIYVSVEVSSSIVLLPEKPMVARYENNKVGYFTTPQTFFSDKQQQMEERKLITRWRMEPKEEDVQAYLSGTLVEPQKPILFYIDSSTPPQWRKYIKEGVENWQVAFERAGFKNAIIATELPDSIQADADDVNYSVITYVASPKANAMGPSICDPRSGEIIEADIIWWHNVMSMLQKWITVQTGTVNPAARTLPLPEDLMGEAIRFVACHEVGHSLGLRHNMMGSAAFPTDSLRSKTFTDKMNSTSSSIMDYARFNYVAQPEDGVTQLCPNIGPYDLFAIEYGYRWTNNTEPEKDADFLYNLMQKHTGTLYKYSEAQDSRGAVDPRAQNEDLGDDPVKSSQLGIANLKRIMPFLVEWTKTGKKGQSYVEAGRLYYAVINQWNNYLYHVLANIGGIYMENIEVDDGQKKYTFVEKNRQAASLDFLLEEVLGDPSWLFGTEINQYVFPTQNTPIGYVENAPSLIRKNAQSYIFWDLLENKRLIRMLENERTNGKSSYTVVELLDRIHKHSFGITERGSLPDVTQRELQKGLVDALILSVSKESTNKETKKLMDEHYIFGHETPGCSCHDHDLHVSGSHAISNPPNFYGSYSDRVSDAISVKRGELLRIKELLEKRKQTADLAVQYHYKDMILRINAALDIK